MMSITLPEWFVWALLAILVAHVGLGALKAWLIYEVRRVCNNRLFSAEDVRAILRVADR